MRRLAQTYNVGQQKEDVRRKDFLIKRHTDRVNQVEIPAPHGLGERMC